MANMLFANNANTTLNGGITTIATSMVVTSATGFPSPTGSQYFYCTLADAATQTTIEIVKVTAVSGTTFTIVRGQDGTTGTAFAAGAVVSLRLVRASLNDFPKLDEANTFTQAQTFSALTSGRIPYSSTGGLQTDSANLTFNGSTLTISSGELYTYAGTSQRGGLETYAYSSTNSYDAPRWNAWRARGTLASPSAVLTGDELASWEISGWAANSTWVYAGGIFLYATGTVSGANVPSYMSFQTNSAGSATEAMRINSSGGVSIGNTTDPGAGNLRFNTTNTNGIYFGSSSILSDYEQGTWSPTAVAITGTITAYTSSGVYTKIGRSVTVQATINISNNGTGASFVRITNLPYTPASTVFTGSGRENGVSGSQLSASTGGDGTSVLNIFTYASLYPGSTGASIAVTITYSV